MLVAEASSLSHLPNDAVVIVGGGTVGLFLAVQLSSAGRDVVVVESGERQLGGFDPSSFTSIGRKHDGIRVGRSRSLGGTSNLWGGQLVEFQAVDFEGRPWLPGSRWPITRDDVAPFYRRAYSLLGLEGPALDDEAVWKGIGLSPPVFAEGIEGFLTRWLRVPSMYVKFRTRMAEDPRIRLVLGHTVTGFAADGPRITAVRAVSPDGAAVSIRGSDFVLSAGTLETVRLLLNSACDRNWHCPWRDNPNVGLRFQDHLGGRVADLDPLDRRRFFQAFGTIAWKGDKFQPKARFAEHLLRDQRLLSVQGMIAFESSFSENFVFLKQFLKAAIYSREFRGARDLIHNSAGCLKYMLPLMWTYLVDHRIFVPSGSKVALVIQSEQYPVESSRISIDPATRDRFGLPRLVLDWRIDGNSEFGSIRDFSIRLADSLQAAGLARAHLAPKLLDQDSSFLSSLRDTNHQSGGAVMAESADHGVVDRDLRVFNTLNLFVASPAVFRTNSNANVTFTAMALSLRLCDYLASSGAPR